jgi:hypothetical protein
MDRGARGTIWNGLVPIEIPSLAIREAELRRIVDEYTNDAIAALGAHAVSFIVEIATG